MTASPKCPTCKRPIDDDKHRGFFFKAVASAFDNWPATHPFQPENTEHLRSWLMIEAGHHTTVDIEGPEAVTVANLKIAASLLGKPHAFRMGRIANGIRVYAAVSMAKDSISKKGFDTVALDVCSLIEAIVGVGVDRLVREGVSSHADNGIANPLVSE